MPENAEEVQQEDCCHKKREKTNMQRHCQVIQNLFLLMPDFFAV